MGGAGVKRGRGGGGSRWGGTPPLLLRCTAVLIHHFGGTRCASPGQPPRPPKGHPQPPWQCAWGCTASPHRPCPRQVPRHTHTHTHTHTHVNSWARPRARPTHPPTHPPHFGQCTTGETECALEQGLANQTAKTGMSSATSVGAGRPMTPAVVGGGEMHWKGRGDTPPSRAPSLCSATVPLTPSAASMAFVTDSDRPQPLWQPPPTACLTASGAASEATSLQMHVCGGGGRHDCRPIEGDAIPGA